jgi:hypothetical protein
VAIKPFRATAGLDMGPGTAAWQGGLGVGGLYYKVGVGVVMRKTDNSETTLGAGGGGGTSTLALTYAAGASSADSILSLDVTRGKLLIKDNAAPIGTLFEMQSSAGASHYLFNASNMTFGAGRGVGTVAGAGAFDFSNATGTFKTSTGAHTFGSAAWAVPANLAITGAASATNTNAMTLQTNVVDGATSIGLRVNNTTTLTTTGARLISIQNGGVEAVGLTIGALNLLTSTLGNFGFQNGSQSGVVAQGSSLYFYSLGTAALEVLSSNYLRPNSDLFMSLGTSTSRFNGVYNGGPVGARYTTQSATTYTVTALDHYIGMSNVAARTVTLCAASAIPAGQWIVIKDENCNAATANVTINRAGSDTIVAATTGGTSVVINTNGGLAWLMSDGTSKWFKLN